MRIDVLGPLRLCADTGEVIEIAERKLRLLLAALVAAEGEPVTADTLIDRLWDSRLPADPPKVLRSKLSHLRTALDMAEVDGRDRLKHTPAGYRLALDPDTVDATRFSALIARARHMTSPNHRTGELQHALDLWRGEAYGDLADEVWLAPVITDLHSARGDALELLVEALAEDGKATEAIEAANSALRAYPTRERLITALMLALYRAGRQHEALETFEQLRHRLVEELGVDPGPQVRELHGRILRQDPALGSPPPTTTSTPASPARSNLPAETTPLIGRRRESDQVSTLLAGSRLVTLTGIGGVGKTRLALHVARRWQTQAERGVWFIDLSELSGPAREEFTSGNRIASLVISALDLPERDVMMNDVERVAGALAAQSALLVLDNCEHVVAEAGVFASELLGSAPGVQVLTTSREPLALPEEQRYDVSTLDTEAREGQTVSEAAEFFAARARTSDPSFQIDETTIAAVIELCRRLDGLPLALELAAARIRGISVEDLLHRLSDRLNILQRPGRGVPRRQQTLRGMIDWSWSLLDTSEQIVLRRLAVHPGSLTLDAAEVICADDPKGADAVVYPSQVVDLLIRLVDRSMVQAVSTPTGVRYGLLESIATFAAEKLDEPGERVTVARRHLDYYLGFAQEAERHLRGPRQHRWLARLEAERAQLRHAFEEVVANPDRGSAVALAVATFWYHWISGRHGPIHDDLRRAINVPGPHDNNCAAATTLEACFRLHDRPGEEARLVAESLSLFSGDDVARARVQWFAGGTLLALGVREAGEQHVDEAITTLAEAGEEWDMAVAATQRDWFLISNWAEQPRGLPDGRDLEMVLRELGEGYGLVQVLGVQHRAAEIRGDHLRAADAAARALSISLDFGLWGEAADFLAATATAALRSGDVAAAQDRLDRAKSLAMDMAYDHGASVEDLPAAMLARYQGDLQDAHALLERWLNRGGLQATQDTSVQLERGFLAAQQADHDRAQQALDTARELLPAAPDAPVWASVLELAAAIRALNGDVEAAAELLGSAAAHRERVGAGPSAPAQQDVEWVRSQLV